MVLELLEAVLESKPNDGETFGTWYREWLELVRKAEDARQKSIDDDMKCVVVRRSAPKELADHLTLNASIIADKFPVMHDLVHSWCHLRGPHIVLLTHTVCHIR